MLDALFDRGIHSDNCAAKVAKILAVINGFVAG
jgi:hypothetical protein